MLSPTTPSSAYRPTFGVTYGGGMQPTGPSPTAPTMRSPIPSLLNPPTPMQPPSRPAGGSPGLPGSGAVTAPGSAVGGVLGSLAGGGPYSAMPGGFGGALAGSGTPSVNPAQTPGRTDPGYSPIPGMDYIGPALSLAGTMVPGMGLLGTAGRGYNLMEANAARQNLGMPELGFWQQLGAVLGLNGYASGDQIYGGQPTNVPGINRYAPRGGSDNAGGSRNPQQAASRGPMNVAS